METQSRHRHARFSSSRYDLEWTLETCQQQFWEELEGREYGNFDKGEEESAAAIFGRCSGRRRR
jgi:hypothetical protein